VSSKKLVSIGMPVYNGDKYLEQALDSLLDQTFKNFEVIISDNGSSDKTQSICEDYVARDDRIKYHRSDKNRGAAWNFNNTFLLSKGKYFKWLSHDDYLAPTYLSCCVDAMEKAPEAVALCFPMVQYIDNVGQELSEKQSLHIQEAKQFEKYDRLSFSRLLSLSPACYPIFVFGLVRANILRQTGLIGAYVMSDLILVAELRLLGEFIEIPQRLFYQRVYKREITRDARSKVKGEALWYNPENSNKFIFPNLKLIFEYFKIIHQHEYSWKKRGNAYFVVISFILITLKRSMHSSIWKKWSYVSVSLIRILPITSIPMRIWCFAAGLRGNDKKTSMLAFSGPWLTPSKDIFNFAAKKLVQRNDSYADAILNDWLNSELEHCRGAAHEVKKNKQ
jgi:glycosyltransferase involved in cell wall biosynthesis